MKEKIARLIAYYLPQFHPIPENDGWWGKGFTEWTNVSKAKPLFRNHYQPRLPADLGYYDLRLHEARQAQAEMADRYGIEGFCYWHYWFAGKRILERPLLEVLRSGEPKLPFCLGWANASWSGIWQGCPDRTLIEQTYPGERDEEAHFYALLDVFRDKRHITIEGKPVFLVYQPELLPDPKRFIDHWQRLAAREGLKGIYFIGNGRTRDWMPETDGFDAMVPHNPPWTLHHSFDFFHPQKSFVDRACIKIFGKIRRYLYPSLLSKSRIVLYEDYIRHALPPLRKEVDEYPCVVPNWDNTPRCGVHGWVFHDSTPDLFRVHLKEAIEQVKHRDPEKRIIFVKSWNEWGEGNYLEPDQKFGSAYLDVCKDEVFVKLITKQ